MASQNTKFLVQEQGDSLVEVTTNKPVATEANEVVISLKAIAINPADVKMIDQAHRVTSWPLTPGLDGAGIVEAVGSKVSRFVVGDRVLAQFVPGDRGGSYQNFAVVAEKMVAKVPETWSLENAATLGVCYFTAIVGLGVGLKTPLPFLPDGPRTGFEPSSILVLGGSSALGAATIQLLRLAVPECKIFTTSSPKHHKHLTDNLGADVAFDRSSASLVAEVKSASPSTRGVEAIFDAVGAGSSERHIFDSLDPEGSKTYAQVWTGDDEIEAPEGVNSILFRGRDVPKLQGNENIMQALQDLLAEGKYKLPLPVHHFGDGIDGLEKGLSLMRHGVSGEKLMVTI